ncbi:hypothetical protein FR943_21470 [Mycobacterium sp. TNTM28]|uniref:Uncharacterized protein n=1 Tax=[Mycobacterium] fortunisiensis TaxID=2600579 RepID=A0ABS6KSZ9_9MYCO|nr:hypothetical protein [[Mycobacterium] fortunisiensis]MBU9766401.1 hypothetical protein [[Mycobacterium] fortunisiensis]
MSELRLYIPALATPLNVLLLLWMAVGRGLFVPMGWMTVLIVLASPVLVLCLVITTRQIHRLRGELTSGQAGAQLVLWSAMFGFGLFLADGGDSGTFPSILMKLLGEPPWGETVSMFLWWCCVFAGPVAWFVLQSRLARSLGAATPAPHPTHPYPGYPPGYPGPGPMNGHQGAD